MSQAVRKQESDLWKSLNEVAKRSELERNLRGMTYAKCKTCRGTGYETPGYDDYDGNGRFYVSGRQCRHCLFGGAEVPCRPEKEAAAIQLEIDELRARLKPLKAAIRKKSKQ